MRKIPAKSTNGPLRQRTIYLPVELDREVRILAAERDMRFTEFVAEVLRASVARSRRAAISRTAEDPDHDVASTENPPRSFATR